MRPWIAAAFLFLATDLRALPPEGEAWSVVRSPNLTVYTNAPPSAVRRVVESFETLRAGLGVLAPGVPLRSPVPVELYVFKDARSFRPYARLHAGTDVATAPGYIRQAGHVDQIALPIDDVEVAFETVLRSYIARLIEATYPTAPLWVESGLSQIYGGARRTGAKLDIGRPNLFHLDYLKQNGLKPVADLFAFRELPTPDDGPRAAPIAFEAESWLLLHMLLVGDEAIRPKTIRYLGLLGAGANADTALREAFGESVSGFDALLAAYLKRTSMAFLSIDAGKLDLSGIDAPQPLDRGQTLTQLGWLLANIDPVNAPEAERHFRAALAARADLASAHAGLGWIAFRAKRYDDASAEFGAAVAGGADDPVTLLMAARSLLAQAEAARKTFDAPKALPAGIANAREYLVRAASARPRHGETLAALGATYLYDPVDVEPGIAALQAALTAMPPRTDVLLNLVTLYGRKGDTAHALEIVDGPIAALDDPATTTAARERLTLAGLAQVNAQIGAGRLDDAVALLRTLRDAAPTDRLKTVLDGELARIAPVAKANRHAALFNAAAELANRGKWTDVRPILETILAEAPEADVRARCEDLLARASKAAGPKSR